MNWIPHPTTLTGNIVRLEPLATSHIPALLDIGVAPEIWTHWQFGGTVRSKLQTELNSALLLRSQGSQYPFVVIAQKDEKVIGSTRLFDLHPEHKKLEIGWTWYAPEYWGKGYNTECKLLLFRFCFEILGVHRIQLKTRETNQRSAAAIRKAGAQYEGILRKDRVMPDGQVRDTMMFSIIDEEWPVVEKMLAGSMRAMADGQAELHKD